MDILSTQVAWALTLTFPLCNQSSFFVCKLETTSPRSENPLMS